MAINKNDFKNAEGNYEAKNALMDAVIDGVNGNEAQLNTHMADYATFVNGGDVHTATLQNGWTHPSLNLRCYKNDLGFAFLYGRIEAGDITEGTVITQLPSEFRPFDFTTIPAYDLGRGKPYVGLVLTSARELVIRLGIDSLISSSRLSINVMYRTL